MFATVGVTGDFDGLDDPDVLKPILCVTLDVDGYAEEDIVGWRGSRITSGMI